MSKMQLECWLKKIRLQHRLEIDLSLERVKSVAKTLNVAELPCFVVTVAGTNGKGSTVAGLEKIWLTAGYRVGAFTSPWLYRFNEIVRVQGAPVMDDLFISAFEKIELARGDLTLTQFEFNTLAALLIFQAAELDIAILEVGLGGRLDAVNIIDADLAVVTSIDLDHTDRLGDTREKIGFEKAGIFRRGQLAVCGDLDPPVSLKRHAKVLGTQIFYQGQDFDVKEETEDQWNFWRKDFLLTALPKSRLLLTNMATVLMAVNLLQDRLPVQYHVIQDALRELSLPGRIEVRPGAVTTILDVSHNPAAAKVLANFLRKEKITGKTRAVFSMLDDKDILSTIHNMLDVIDEWFVAPLSVPRAASLSQLKKIFNEVNLVDEKSQFTSDIKEAYSFAKQNSVMNDRIVIFGSFYTVSGVLTERYL